MTTPTTGCCECGRTSEVVDMTKCPFCHQEKAGWELELVNLPAINYNLYFGSPATRRDMGDTEWTYADALRELKSFIRSIESAALRRGRDEAMKCVPEERPDPGDFGGTDDKLVREQWWGFENCRRQMLKNLEAARQGRK